MRLWIPSYKYSQPITDNPDLSAGGAYFQPWKIYARCIGDLKQTEFPLNLAIKVPNEDFFQGPTTEQDVVLHILEVFATVGELCVYC